MNRHEFLSAVAISIAAITLDPRRLFGVPEIDSMLKECLAHLEGQMSATCPVAHVWEPVYTAGHWWWILRCDTCRTLLTLENMRI